MGTGDMLAQHLLAALLALRGPGTAMPGALVSPVAAWTAGGGPGDAMVPPGILPVVGSPQPPLSGMAVLPSPEVVVHTPPQAVVAVLPAIAVLTGPSPLPVDSSKEGVPAMVAVSSQVSTSTGTPGVSVVDGVWLADAARCEVYICYEGPLGSHLKTEVRERIWKGECVEIFSLLPLEKFILDKIKPDESKKEEEEKLCYRLIPRTFANC